MSGIRTSTLIAAPPAVVWAHLADIATHVEWMADAEAIRFTSDRHEGVGTTFDCDTRVGPVRLVDRMEITRWEPGRAMGVRHVGVVTGTGEFTLEPVGRAHTTFGWREVLTFPWWLGGAVGARIARPVLTWVWRRNLARLRAAVEGARPGSSLS